MKKRSLLIIAIVACLVAVLACGSLAYFTGTAQTKNKFMVASSDDPNPDPDDIFSIVVEEEEPTPDEDEQWEAEPNEENGYDYSNILPGDKLDKVVTVKNTGDYDQYVRVKVVISDIAAWKEIATANGFTLASMIKTIDSNVWTKACEDIEDAQADTLTMVYYLNDVLGPDESAKLFDAIEIPTSITVEQFATITGFSLTVQANAIQTAHTGTIAEAFAIYDAQ